jgi:hypothetical protein
LDCDISKILHPNSVKLINELQEKNIGTVVFDECHHLQSYWALTMREIVSALSASNVIGLTATPPIDIDKEKLKCYTTLFGEVDYQIPTPAVVKEGMLAPYQDLVYFCMPNEEEIKYIEICHLKFKNIINLFDKAESDFYFWVYNRIVKRILLSGEVQDWTRFINSRQGFAVAGVKYLLNNGCKLPWDITITEDMYEHMSINDWIYLIEDYALNLLKLSSKEEDKLLYDEIREALKRLGYILTEKGVKGHSSPIDRVLAYSKSKLEAVKEILKAEMASIEENIRVGIITDFEISNALTLKNAQSVLDDECGGAISVMKELVSDKYTDLLDPVMITSNKLICDDDLAKKFVEYGNQWSIDNFVDVHLSAEPTEFNRFVSILGSGKDWGTKTAVLLTTYLLDRGITKCIIGTRGLLSEGWDSISLNTLIDLTAVTTFASVNQLRGRSIRKSENNPLKTSNNWDVICIAPDLEKGYNDLNRLYRKHEQFYGVCDDGQIQRGIDHLDPSINTNNRLLNEDDMCRINNNMLNIIIKRERTYKLWKIGEPFDNTELECCEIKIGKPIKMKAGCVLVNEKNILKGKINRNILKMISTVLPFSGAGVVALSTPLAAVPIFAFSVFMGYKTYKGLKDLWKYGKENFFKLTVKSITMDISKCLFFALRECGIINGEICEEKIVLTERSDGTIRVYLDGFDEDSKIFSNSLAQIFSPIENQRYGIQRYDVIVPNGQTEKIIYLFRYGYSRYSPILTCYHPLPDMFSTKEKALVFKKYWNEIISPGEIVFLKGEKGREIIEKYGRINFFNARKKNVKVWK